MSVPMTDFQNLDERTSRLEGGDLIAAMADAYGQRFAVVSSFGTESAVLLHLAAQVSADIPVIFLNTGKLYGETLRYKQTLTARLGLTNVRITLPDPSDVAEQDPKGDSWLRNADQCCFIRKVRPLSKALRDFDAWATGRKNYQGGERSSLQTIEQVGLQVKANPLAHWSEQDVESYFIRHDLPRHPLLADGYTSVGCMPCTTPTSTGESSRAGRWRDSDKTECGIHLPEVMATSGAAQ